MKDYLPDISGAVPQEEDSVSLRDIIDRLKEYAAELRRSWKTLLVFCLPFMVWQGYLALTTPVTYLSKLTFMVDDDSGSRGGLINNLLGGIGLSTENNNNDKILELARSLRIIRQALFRQVTIDGKTDFLANHFIRIQHLHEEVWNKKPKNPGQPGLKGFLFTRDSVEQFTRIENAALKSLYGMLTGSEDFRPLFGARNNADSGIMTLSIETRSEALTIAMLRAIFDELSAFYINASTEKQLETYEIVRDKADSLRRLLSGTEFRAAQFREQNNLLLRPTDQVPSERLERNKNIYALMYGESIKNLELADFALRNRIPYVQPIDLPIPPLVGTPYGKKKALVLGLGLGLLLGGLFVTGRKAIRDQLAGNPPKTEDS